MISAERRSALDALDVARPDVERLLDDPQSAAAGLRAAWDAAEAALRSLLGEHATSAVGHALIREARQHQVITFDQANALAALHSIRERLDFPEYVVTDADADSARTAIEKLAMGLQPEGSIEAVPSAVVPAAGPGEPVAIGVTSAAAASPVKSTGMPRWPVAALAAVVVIGIAGWAVFGLHRTDPMLERGIDDYAHGRHDVAASEFEQAAKADPKSARPHVYLARIDRESGNFATANEELQTALRLEPNDEPARREMGSLLLAQGNYDLARVFYIHALEIDGADLDARGWLGCALLHLGRADEGTHWLDMAGTGPWSVCRPMSTPSAAKAPPGSQ